MHIDTEDKNGRYDPCMTMDELITGMASRRESRAYADIYACTTRYFNQHPAFFNTLVHLLLNWMLNEYANNVLYGKSENMIIFFIPLESFYSMKKLVNSDICILYA